jgi:hypothetical protein
MGFEDNIASKPSSWPRAFRHSRSLSITWKRATTFRKQLGGVSTSITIYKYSDVPLNFDISISYGYKKNVKFFGLCRESKEHSQNIVNAFWYLVESSLEFLYIKPTRIGVDDNAV